MRPLKSHNCWCVEFLDHAQLASYEDNNLQPIPPTTLASKFRNLIDSDPTEEEVQTFLEHHPRCLPEAGYYHHGFLSDVVVSKLPLHNDFITDFAYISANSQSVLVVCLEIEKPGMKIFCQDGHFTAHYQKARQQVIDWNFWAQHNIRDALKYFGKYAQHLPSDTCNIQMHCILIVGRRSELTTRKRRERWSAEAATLPKSISVMTYDRLLEGLEREVLLPENKKILVCSYRDRSLQVKHVTA
jgi:hypothetical protein